jgi:hypothetical protein
MEGMSTTRYRCEFCDEDGVPAPSVLRTVGSVCELCGKTAGTGFRYHCHAEGCEIVVPPLTLLCTRHFLTLPDALRELVWSACDRGPEDRVAAINHIKAAISAVEWLAEQEGRRDNDEIDCICDADR